MDSLITSTSNPRVVEVRKLSQKKHRGRQGRFAAEGLQILHRAVDATAGRLGERVRPIEVFHCRDLFTSETAERLLRELTEAGAQPVAVTPAVLESISDRVHSQGLLATFATEALRWRLDELPPVSPPSLYVLLDRPQYPGNVGTLLRTADAVGASAVLIVGPSADPFDPQAVRSSRGSIFSMPIVPLDGPEQLASWSDRCAVRWLGADPAADVPIWDSGMWEGLVGVALGSEPDGLQPDVAELVDRRVRIPQRGDADSLNVAVAGGVLMYEWFRANRHALH